MTGLLLYTYNALLAIVLTSGLVGIANALHLVGFGGRITAALAEVYRWILPFTWVAWVCMALIQAGLGFVLVSGLSLAMAYWTYRDWKKSDDDRWKKVRRKISAKVSFDSTGRLAVVPT